MCKKQKSEENNKKKVLRSEGQLEREEQKKVSLPVIRNILIFCTARHSIEENQLITSWLQKKQNGIKEILRCNEDISIIYIVIKGTKE